MSRGVGVRVPDARALKGLDGWITGLCRDQNVTRTALTPMEIDAINGGILNVNPLLEWSEAQVWEYTDARRIPTNRLHKGSYPSIGCAPCTRPVAPGEHPRAGCRWEARGVRAAQALAPMLRFRCNVYSIFILNLVRRRRINECMTT
jgi:3'-phosphoadenosine 5'-phosphosulfate sulfotransferase (PAPS reductase)/FAD synthetase